MAFISFHSFIVFLSSDFQHVSPISLIHSSASRFLLLIPSRTSLVAQMVKHLSTMQETWVWSLGQEDPLEKEMAIHSSTIAWKIPWTEESDRASLVAQTVKHLPAMRDIRVRSLGWEDPLEKAMAIHSSTIQGVIKSQTWLSDFTFQCILYFSYCSSVFIFSRSLLNFSYIL